MNTSSKTFSVLTIIFFITLLGCTDYAPPPTLKEEVTVVIDNTPGVSTGVGHRIEDWSHQGLKIHYQNLLVEHFAGAKIRSTTSNVENSPYKIVIKQMTLQQSSSSSRPTHSNCGFLTNLLRKKRTLYSISFDVTVEFYQNDVLQATWVINKHASDQLKASDCGSEDCCPSFHVDTDGVYVEDILVSSASWLRYELEQKLLQMGL
ncbi:MAG TPA: hypothetical protein DCS93_11640 [Microscillaceae bacterium]|nr:hypothetical protein [Microscillaceae bacterium]